MEPNQMKQDDTGLLTVTVEPEHGGNHRQATRDTQSARKRVTFCGLFRYATAVDAMLLLIGTISALVFGLCLPLTILFTGTLFDAFGMTTVSQASRTSLYFVYIGGAVLVSASLMMICFSVIAARMTTKAQTAFFEAILKHDVTYYDIQGSSVGLSTLASSSMELYKAAVGQKLGMAIQSFSVIVAAIVIGFTYAWQLCLVVMAFLPLLGLGGYLFGSQSSKFAAEQVQAYGEAGALVDEALGSIRTVTALSLQHHFVERLKASLVGVTRRGRAAGWKLGMGIGLLLFAFQVSFSPSYYVGALLITNAREAAFISQPPSNPSPFPFCAVGQPIPVVCSTQPSLNLTFETAADVCNCALCLCGCYSSEGKFDSAKCITGGGILLVFFSVIVAGFGLGQFFPNYQAIQLGRSAAATIFEIIDNAEQARVERNQGRTVVKSEMRGEIRFESARFAYPARPDVMVLQDTNLVIPAGKRIAVCGASGSGKSSIVSLILRFYDLKSGRLLIDGTDVRELNTESLRTCIGLVSQEPVLFAGVTVRENVRYGNPSASDEEVEAACRMANAYDFVQAFPDKFDTVLVGSSLSGGQKQRLAIA
jgi:ATP-binding cassette, subfamily B (MDR/TAP), member 1